MSIPEKFIRVASDQLDFSRHALKRMRERQVTRDDVILAVKLGKVIETQIPGQDAPPDKDDVRVLFQHSSSSDIYVVVAACFPPQVITVCRFIEQVWEDLGVFRQRRKQYEMHRVSRTNED